MVGNLKELVCISHPKPPMWTICASTEIQQLPCTCKQRMVITSAYFGGDLSHKLSSCSRPLLLQPMVIAIAAWFKHGLSLLKPTATVIARALVSSIPASPSLLWHSWKYTKKMQPHHGGISTVPPYSSQKSDDFFFLNGVHNLTCWVLLWKKKEQTLTSSSCKRRLDILIICGNCE